eukprot:scaffold49989_cov29-Attheya_sp.AAC.4
MSFSVPSSMNSSGSARLAMPFSASSIPRKIYRHGANGDGKEPRVCRNSRLSYTKKECYDSLHWVEMWCVKHRKSKKCDNKATNMAKTSIMHTPYHNTERQRSIYQ